MRNNGQMTLLPCSAKRSFSVGKGILNSVFPSRCPVCDEPVKPFGALICTDCRQSFLIPQGSRCFLCGKPLAVQDSDREYCSDCSEKEHMFDRGYSLFVYGSTAASLYRFKYKGRREYASFYAKCFVRLYAKGRDGLFIHEGRGILADGHTIEALIPVPLHQKRQKMRGYNQSEEFARAISDRTGVPVHGDLVKRVKNTRPMKELDVIGRRNNLKNAFIIGKNDVLLNSVAIVDDIYTTGSTVDAIASLLRRQGIRYIYVFTIAVGTQ